jgi:PAS domain S-box-containing protein
MLMRSLNRKILFYLLALWGGLVVVSFLGLLRLNAIDQASDELLEGVYPASAAALEVESAIYNAYQNTIVYCAYFDADAKSETHTALEQADRALNKYFSVSRNVQQDQREELQALLDDAKKHAVDCLRMTDAGMTPAEFQTHIGELNQVQVRVVLALRNAASHEQKKMLSSAQRIDQEIHRGFTIFVVGAFLLLMIALFLGYRLSNVILPPLAALTTAAEGFSDKNLNVRVDKVLPGEFGVLASAFNSMAARIQHALEENNRLLGEVTASQNKYQDLYDNAPNGYHSLAPDGTIIEINNTELNWLGYNRQEVVSIMNTRDIIDESCIPMFETAFRALREEGTPVNAECIFKRFDGATFPGRVNNIAVFDANGQFLYSRCSVRDITQEKEVYRQLLQSQKLESLGTLSGGIAHDFNNLLTSIMGFAQLAMLNLDPESQTYNNLDRVVNLGNQAAGLTRQLLTFSRRSHMEKTILSPVHLVKETVKVIERTFPETIHIRSHIDRDIANIEADATQIQQVLMNLCVNARDAMPDGGSLRISLTNIKNDDHPILEHGDHPPDHYVCLSIKDTGSGIPHHTQERMFEPFFTTKDVGKGTGLGLSIVHGIVESHGGHIHLNTELGNGTEFLIYLPAIGEAATEETTDAIPRTGNETILLVEDDANVRDVAQKMLAKQGYTVLTATNGMEELDVFRTHQEKIDLVVTDVVMPKLSGLELSAEVARQDPHAKVLLISGYVPEQEHVSQCIIGFLSKPFEAGQLTAAVRKALDTSPVTSEPEI